MTQASINVPGESSCRRCLRTVNRLTRLIFRRLAPAPVANNLTGVDCGHGDYRPWFLRLTVILASDVCVRLRLPHRRDPISRVDRYSNPGPEIDQMIPTATTITVEIITTVEYDSVINCVIDLQVKETFGTVSGIEKKIENFRVKIIMIFVAILTNRCVAS